MGCASSREKIESRMLILKLKRIEIKQEREERIKALEKLTGKEIKRKSVPDYIEKKKDGNDDMDSEKNSDINTIVNQNENIILNKNRHFNFDEDNLKERESDNYENNKKSFNESESDSNYENEESLSSEKKEIENISSENI
jgi:hypothetical protein